MKLSEILKDWPEKWLHTVTCEMKLNGFRCTCNANNYNTALTSSDREIDREALENELSEALFYGHTYSEIVERLISTMPTWLKRIEDK